MEKDNETLARNAESSVASGKNRIVETYAEDMAQVIEDDKSGLVKKIIHEEEEHEIEKKNISPESKKNKIFMFVGLLFIIFGFFTLFYFIFVKTDPTVPIEKQLVPIIFNDKNVLLEVHGLKKDEIVQTVLKEINGTLVKNGGVEGIYLTLNDNPLGFRKFIEIINGDLILNDSNFVDDNFLMGVVNTEAPLVSSTGKDFFILLKVRSMVDVFDIMRAWENKMFSDLYGFFGLNITSETKYLLTTNFKDGIIENKNARILYDNDNKIVMMYIFADDNSIVITNTESAGEEIMLRLASSRIKK